jgi:hypothetical protein
VGWTCIAGEEISAAVPVREIARTFDIPAADDLIVTPPSLPARHGASDDTGAKTAGAALPSTGKVTSGGTAPLSADWLSTDTGIRPRETEFYSKRFQARHVRKVQFRLSPVGKSRWSIDR